MNFSLFPNGGWGGHFRSKILPTVYFWQKTRLLTTFFVPFLTRDRSNLKTDIWWGLINICKSVCMKICGLCLNLGQTMQETCFSGGLGEQNHSFGNCTMDRWRISKREGSSPKRREACGKSFWRTFLIHNYRCFTMHNHDSTTRESLRWHFIYLLPPTAPPIPTNKRNRTKFIFWGNFQNHSIW